MQSEALRGAAVDELQEGEELSVGVTRRAATDDLAGERAEGGIERGRAMAGVVVGAALGSARAQGQDGTRTVDRLDLRLLIVKKQSLRGRPRHGRKPDTSLPYCQATYDAEN
jgi:hypothetical protein